MHRLVAFLYCVLSCTIVCGQSLSTINIGNGDDTLRLNRTLRNNEFEGNVLPNTKVLFLGEKIKVVPCWSFALMPKLSAVSLQNSTIKIDDNAFFSCRKLCQINLDNIHHLGDNALQNTAIITADISSATHIGELAFAGCSNLKNVLFSETVMHIGAFAFRGDTSLTECDIYSGTIDEFAFSNCSGITSAVLRNDFGEVKSIGKGAFYNCTSLQTVFMPCGITKIPDMLFMGCKSLLFAEIPPNVKTIGEYAFFQTALDEVVIPYNVKTIKAHAFESCENLRKVVLMNKNTQIEHSAFDDSVELIFND